MITVTLFKKDGCVVRVCAVGHSGLGEAGSDVLCAAVSTLVQTAYLAVVDIAGEVGYRSDAKRGYFDFSVPNVADRHDIDVVLRAMYIGLKDLSSGYPQNLKLEEA